MLVKHSTVVIRLTSIIVAVALILNTANPALATSVRPAAVRERVPIFDQTLVVDRSAATNLDSILAILPQSSPRAAVAVTLQPTFLDHFESIPAHATTSSPGNAVMPGTTSAADARVVLLPVTWKTTLSPSSNKTSMTSALAATATSLPRINLSQRLFLPLVLNAYAPPTPITTTVTPEVGGQLITSGGRVTIDIPPHAVNVPTRLDSAPLLTSSLPAGTVSAALSFHVEAQPQVTVSAGAKATSAPEAAANIFNQPVRLTFAYDPGDLTGKKDETRLVVRTRSGPGAPWTSLPTQIDLEHHTATAYTIHFSDLTLAATAPLSAPIAIDLAPLISSTTSSTPGIFFTHTVVVTREQSTWPVILSSWSDGQGELYTADAMTMTVSSVSGTLTYQQLYLSGTLPISTSAQDVSALFGPGLNTVQITLTKLSPGPDWTYGYRLVTVRNPYARDLGGSYPIALAEHTIDLISGNFVWSETDVATGGFGPGSAFVRTYNSRSSEPGVFGLGWSSPYDSRAWVALDGSVEVRRADGQRELFTPNGSGYQPEPGVFDTLRRANQGWELTEFPSQVVYVYNAAGQIVQMADAYGNVVQIDHQTDRLTVTDAAGRDYTLILNNGQVVALNDPLGRRLTYRYADNTLIGVTDARGLPITYTYTSAGLLTGIANSDGVVLTNTYDENGWLIGQVDGNGVSKTLLPQPDQNLSVYTNGAGQTISAAYDQRNRLSEVTYPDRPPVRYAYTDHDQLSVLTDSLGLTRTFDWAGGNLTRLTDGLGKATEFAYDPALNQPITQRDPLGAMTTYTYTPQGNVTGVHETGLLTLTLDYDARGRITHLANGAGYALSAGYGGPHQDLTVITDTLGQATATPTTLPGKSFRAPPPTGKAWD